MERLSAPERTREELRALMNGELGTAAGRGDLVRLALRLIVEEALEGEVSDALGRERYERGEDGKAGYRNGYRPGKIKTAEGAVDYSAPQVRDTPEPFVSGVRAALSGRTRELERLAVELYARGLSTRDIEDAFTDETGRRLLSRAAVSEITEKLWAEYEDFCKRDLSEHAVACLFIDGIAERLRPGQRREAVLAGWGIGEDGRKSLLGLMAGSKEDAETVRAFFQDLRARGLGDPLLVVSDGAPGIIRAIEECFPRSARQRCLAHRMRNLAAKVSADPWPVPGSKSPGIKARVTACYQAPSRAIARQLAAGLRADYANVLPSALACFEDDFEACIAHLRLPVTHRRFARTKPRPSVERAYPVIFATASSPPRPAARTSPAANSRRRRSSSFEPTSFQRRRIACVSIMLKGIAPSDKPRNPPQQANSSKRPSRTIDSIVPAGVLTPP